MRYPTLMLCAAFIALPKHALAQEPTSDKVVAGMFQLLAVQGLEEKVIAQYKHNALYPQRKCILMSLTAEFSADFLFYAYYEPGMELRAVCFVPTGGDSKEWTARFAELKGEKSQEFVHLFELLSKQVAESPAAKPLHIYGDSDFRIHIGNGGEMKSMRFAGTVLGQLPKRTAELRRCVKLAGELVGRELPNNIALKTDRAEQGEEADAGNAPE